MVISEETRARIDEEIGRYPAKRGALLDALHRVQAERGHVDAEVARAVAEIFDLRPVEVLEVVSFYNMFFASPQPRHHAYVCTNLPCSLRGARSLLGELRAHCGADADGNTPDGRLHVGHEECLGACANAPMLRVGDTYHEDLSPEEAKRILDELD